MIGKYFECEADRNGKYYRVINTVREYKDGRRFPIDEVVVADKKVDLKAEDKTKLGGFFISTYDYMFRWLIRGDTLCEVIIPDDSKIYKTISSNGIYLADKIILTNPVKVDDNLAMDLYLKSNLKEESYYMAMVACAICGYMNTALKVLKDIVNKDNVDKVIAIVSDYCKRREDESYIEDTQAIEGIKVLNKKLEDIKNGR